MPCVCGQKVESKQNKVKCIICNQYFHCKCYKINLADAELLKGSFKCRACLSARRSSILTTPVNHQLSPLVVPSPPAASELSFPTGLVSPALPNTSILPNLTPTTSDDSAALSLVPTEIAPTNTLPTREESSSSSSGPGGVLLDSLEIGSSMSCNALQNSLERISKELADFRLQKEELVKEMLILRNTNAKLTVEVSDLQALVREMFAVVCKSPMQLPSAKTAGID